MSNRTPFCEKPCHSCGASLRDGRTIRTISALLMQLVQTSSHDVRLRAQSQHKIRVQNAALPRRNTINRGSEEPFLDDTDKEV